MEIVLSKENVCTESLNSLDQHFPTFLAAHLLLYPGRVDSTPIFYILNNKEKNGFL